MKTVEEIKQERDAILQGMEDRYRVRQEEVAREKDAAEKNLDKERHAELKGVEDKNFKDYEGNRAKVWDYHQKEIEEAEKAELEKDDPEMDEPDDRY
jgi:hypothetical protein